MSNENKIEIEQFEGSISSRGKGCKFDKYINKLEEDQSIPVGSRVKIQKEDQNKVATYQHIHHVLKRKNMLNKYRPQKETNRETKEESYYIIKIS